MSGKRGKKMYRVFRTEGYEELFEKLDNREKEMVRNIERQLEEQPFSSKQLGLYFFREKKFEGKRVLFLIYEKHAIVLLVFITRKKTQQRDIDFIKNNLESFGELVKKIP